MMEQDLKKRKGQRKRAAGVHGDGHFHFRRTRTHRESVRASTHSSPAFARKQGRHCGRRRTEAFCDRTTPVIFLSCLRFCGGLTLDIYVPFFRTRWQAAGRLGDDYTVNKLGVVCGGLVGRVFVSVHRNRSLSRDLFASIARLLRPKWVGS